VAENQFDENRLQAIRSTLIACGYKSYPLNGGKAYQYFRDDADSCILPSPGTHFAEMPRMASTAIRSLVRFTGKPLLDLGPLTEREQAYADLVDEIVKQAGTRRK
jgi:hypothetical protein